MDRTQDDASTSPVEAKQYAAVRQFDAKRDGPAALETLYRQVASQHDKIDDFRAKLLAYLPAVTGVGLFAVAEKSPLVAGDAVHSGAVATIGILGALASIGLFVHELRGITECYMLIAIGCAIEHKLTKAEADARCGPFSSRLSWGFANYVSRETAALITYPATIAAWAFVAALPASGHWLFAFALAFFVFIGTVLVAERTLANEGNKVREYLATIESVCKMPRERPVHGLVDRLLRRKRG